MLKYLFIILIAFIKQSFQQACPFDFFMGMTRNNCIGAVSESRVKGGQIFRLNQDNQQVKLMATYGNQGLFGFWKLSDATLMYTTNFYTDNQLEIHSIFITTSSNSQTDYIFILDQDLNLYSHNLYEEQGKLILNGTAKSKKFDEGIQVCYNSKDNTLFFPIENKVYKEGVDEEQEIQLDSIGIQCEDDILGNSIFILSSLSTIYKIDQQQFTIQNQLSFQDGNITQIKYFLNIGLSFLSRNSNGDSVYMIYLSKDFNSPFLIYHTQNQINDVYFLDSDKFIVCGSNSLIYYGSNLIDPSIISPNTNDYQISQDFDFKKINYQKIIAGEVYTIFYGTNIISVLENQSQSIILNKVLLDVQLSGLLVNGVIEDSILKSLSTSGMIYLNLKNGQITRDTSCFDHLDVYEELLTGVYFDEELLRIYAIENQGRFGYFSYPQGSYLTQFNYIQQNSAWLVNKESDQIYVWGTEIPNFILITSYYDGQYLQKINFDLSITGVQFDNLLKIIIVIDQNKEIKIISQQTFLELYNIPLETLNYKLFSSQQGLIIIKQTTIQLIYKDNSLLKIKDIQSDKFLFGYTYFDKSSSNLILTLENQQIQIQNFSKNGIEFSIQNTSILQQGQVNSYICDGQDYIIFILKSPNQVVIYNKKNNTKQIVKDIFDIINSCLIIPNQPTLTLISNLNQFIFIDLLSFKILKKDFIDNNNSVLNIQIDTNENLFVLLFSNSRIVTYNYVNFESISDWTASALPLTSSFQINTTYKLIIYGAALEIYFINYSQKKHITTITNTEPIYGGIIDNKTNSLFTFSNKIFQYEQSTNKYIKQSKYQVNFNLNLLNEFQSKIFIKLKKHGGEISQLNIVYEWNILVTSSVDNTMGIWSYPEMEFLYSLVHDSVYCTEVHLFTVEVGRDRIFSGCKSGSIYIWKRDPSTNNFSIVKEMKNFIDYDLITTITIDIKNDLLILIGWAWHSYILQLSVIEQKTSVVANIHGINGYYDEANQVIVMSDHNGNVWNFNITSKNYIFDKGIAIHQGWVRKVVIDPKEQRFASMSDDGTVQVWPYNSNQSLMPLFQFTNTNPIKNGYLDLNNSILIISDSQFRIFLLKYPLLKVEKVLTKHTDKLNSFIIYQKSFQLLTFSSDKTVMFWDYELAIEKTYSLIVKKSTSIQSYVYDDSQETVYYARTDGSIQKWKKMDYSTYNGFILQDSGVYSNDIFMVNNISDILIIVTSKSIKLLNKTTLFKIYDIDAQCISRIIKDNIVICGQSKNILSYEIISKDNSYIISKIYELSLDYHIYMILEGTQSSSQFMVLLVNQSSLFIESKTGEIKNELPQIHNKLIYEVLLFQDNRIFTYSLDGLLVEYYLDISNNQQIYKVLRQVQLDYPILKVVLNDDYIIIHQEESNFCLIYTNQYSNDTPTFTLIGSLQTPSRWETNVQIVLSPENNTILISSNFYYLIYEYKTFEQIYYYQSNSILEINFMRRQTTLIQPNIIFIQQGETFLMLGQNNKDKNEMEIIQTFNNRYSFYDNIKVTVNKIQDYSVITVLSYNLGGINYFMTDVEGIMPCQQNLLNANFFEIKNTINNYLSLQNVKQKNNNKNVVEHIFNLRMDKSFKFQGFPQIISATQMQVSLTIQGINNNGSKVQGQFFFNQIQNSQNLKSIVFNNLSIIFAEEKQNKTTNQISLKSIQFLKSSIIIAKPPLMIENIKEVVFSEINLINQSIGQYTNIFYIKNSDNVLIENSVLKNNTIKALYIFYITQTLDYTIHAQLIFRGNTVSNNKLTSLHFLYISMAAVVNFDNNTFEDNVSTFTSYVMESLLIQDQAYSNIEFNRNTNFGFLNSSQNLILFDTQITHNLEITHNNLEIKDSHFLENQFLLSDSYLLNCQNNQILIDNTQISKMNSTSYVSPIKIMARFLYIQRFNFTKNQSKNIQNFIISSSLTTQLINSNFCSNQCLSQLVGGAALFIKDSYIFVQDSSFFLNHAQNGGAIYFEGSYGDIQGSQFGNNSVVESGGAILLDNSDLMMQNCILNNNTALIGGGIRYLSFRPMFLNKVTDDTIQIDSCGTYYGNNCLNNHGSYFGNNIGSFPTQISINGQKISNQLTYDFNDVQSGSQSQIIEINLYDEEGTKVVYFTPTNNAINTKLEFQEYRIELVEKYSIDSPDITQRNIKLDGATLKPFQNDQFLLNQYTVSGELGKEGNAQLTFYGFKLFQEDSFEFSETLSVQITYKFRQCNVGEIFIPSCAQCLIVECSPCSNGTYSLIEPKEIMNNKEETLQCKPCDYESSIECYQDNIILKEGYWRQTLQDDIILPCLKSKNRCNGNSTTHYCAEGLVGPLCETCDVEGQFWGQPYGRISFGIDCVQCNTQKIQVLPQLALTLTMIFYLSYLFYITKMNLNMMITNMILQKTGIIRLGATGQVGEKTFYSRLLIRYLQIVALINSLNSNLYQYFRVSFAFISPISSNQDSFDCFLSGFPDTLPVFFYKALWQVVIPLFIIPITFGTYQAVIQIIQKLKPIPKSCYDQQYQKDAIAICLIFLFFFLQQSAFESLIQPLNCKVIGNKKYISNYLLEECHSPKHILLILTIILPFILLWVIIIPAMLMWRIHQQSKKIGNFSNDFKMTKRYGFLFYGYKNDSCLWEFIPMNLRLVLVFIVTYFDDALLLKATLILSFLYLYVLYLEKKKPYQKLQHYEMDIFCSKICCVLCILSTFLNLIESHIIQLIGQIVIVTLIWLSLFKILRMYLDVMIRLNYHSLKKGCLSKLLQRVAYFSCFQRFAKGYLKKAIPALYLLIYETESNSFKKFNNFQLLRLHVQDFIQRKRLNPSVQFYNLQHLEEQTNLNSLSEKNIAEPGSNRNLTNQMLNQSIRKIYLQRKISFQSGVLSPQCQTPKREQSKFQLVGTNKSKQPSNFGFSQTCTRKQSIIQFDYTQETESQADEINTQNTQLFQESYAFKIKRNSKNIPVEIIQKGELKNKMSILKIQDKCIEEDILHQ